MTYEEWVVEAMALREKELADAERVQAYLKAALRAFRDILISVLGLNIGASRDTPAEAHNPEALSSFVPMILSIARPDALKMLFEREEANTAAGDAEQNAAADAMSDSLVAAAARGGADMEPLLEEFKRQDAREQGMADEDMANFLKSLGVVTIDDTQGASEVAHG